MSEAIVDQLCCVELNICNSSWTREKSVRTCACVVEINGKCVLSFC